MFPYIHIYNVNLNICALYTCSRNTKETFLYTRIIYVDASVSESYIIVPLWKCELYFAENKLSGVSKIKPMITSQ